MKKSLLVLCVLALPGCQSLTGPEDPNAGLRRLAIACEAWAAVFRRIDARDALGLASDAEVNAVNEAIPYLQPVCTSPDRNPAGVDLAELERLLLSIYAAEKEDL